MGRVSLNPMDRNLVILSAVVLGDRFGSGKPLAAAILLFLVVLAWLSQTTTVTDYVIGACLLTLAIGLGITYVITIVADLDIDGRYVVLTVPAIGVGVMSGPAISNQPICLSRRSPTRWIIHNPVHSAAPLRNISANHPFQFENSHCR